MLHCKTVYLTIFLLLSPYIIYSKDKIKLIIHNEDKNIIFNVEIAKTFEERKRGLMFRENLLKSEGMLFIFPKEDIIRLWMKNTLIPLDIIFLSHDKKIVDIKHNMKKLSDNVIRSEEKSKYVLELNAGLTQELNIKIGDKVFFYE